MAALRIHSVIGFISISLLCLTSAGTVPSNLQNFITTVKNGGACKNPFPHSFYDLDGASQNFRYCNDYSSQGIIYIKGPGAKLANMDIDCDGIQPPNRPGDDGRCGSSTDTQATTSFQDVVQTYGIEDLNAFVHSYVVLGNYNDAGGKPPKYVTFHPEEHGVEPLSVVAVVCNNQLLYGVWGDANGDDGPPLVGEASISLATLCFGADSVNGNEGHDASDVMYIAFTGHDAVPGAKGADWTATDASSFQASLKTLGDRLVSRISVTSA
ncbi:fungal chitosanase [Tothia fuscella]|uniref:Endo-chitosanase n=1 Tax=Tothia fuscella TaxID=1048955 RepID=A0A9P4NKW1_9PEZI|nr:fungal chitosanase [Tothia fuscella]